VRKFFLAGLGIVTLSLVLMVACSESTDYTVTPGKLPKFRVETTVAQGGVLVTWERVANAQSYEIWRKQAGNSLEGVKLGDVLGTSLSTRYADIKSVSNNLVADTDYQYTVVAVSGTDGLQDRGVESKKVKLTADQLPASISLTAATGLKLEVTSNYRVLATWDADTNPLVTYQVSYNTPYSVTSTTTSANYYIVSSPDVVADVSVKKVVGDGNYYKPSAAASGSISVFPVGSFASISSTAFTTTRDSNNSVAVTLPAYEGFPLAQYDLQRIKLAFNVSSTQQPDGDWTSVSLTGALFTEVSSNNSYKLYDTLPANSGDSSWMYRLIVKYPNSDLIYTVAYRTVSTLPIASLKTPTLSIVKNNEYPTVSSATNDDLAASIYITYDIESDASYTLYRKQISGLNGVALTTGVAYNWEPITVTANKWSSATSETLKVDIPAGNARTNYSYKVVVTGTGSKAGYKSVESSASSSQFRSSIMPSSAYSAALNYPLVVSSDYTSTAYTIPTTGTPTANIYSLNTSGLGLNSKNGDPLLRSGESLTIVITANEGAPSPGTAYASQTVTRGTTLPGGGTATSAGYYFAIPVTPSGSYRINLSVTAR